MPTRPLSRRTILRSLAGSVALPALAAMQPRSSWAAGTTPKIPARMLVAHFGTGMTLHEFFPKETGTDCELPQIVRPLEDYRKRMTIVSGLQLEHGGGHTGCLLYTSPSPRDATLARRPSSA